APFVELTAARSHAHHPDLTARYVTSCHSGAVAFYTAGAGFSRNASAATRSKRPNRPGLRPSHRAAQGRTIRPRPSTGRGSEKTRVAARENDRERAAAASRR